MKKRDSSRLLISIITSGIVILGIWFWVFQASRESLITAGKNEALYISRDVENYLNKNIETVKLCATTIEYMQDNNKSIASILEYMRMQSQATSQVIDENFSGIYGLINDNYLDGMDYAPEAGYVPSERPWYIYAEISENHEPTLVPPYVDSQTKKPVLSISKMLKDNKSVLSMDIYLDYIQGLASKSNAAESGKLIIMDDAGMVVACSEQWLVGSKCLESPGNIYYKIADEVYNKGRSQFETRMSGKKYIVYDQKITGGWHAIILAAKNELFSSLRYVFVLASIVMVLLVTAVILAVRTYYSTKTDAETDEQTGFYNRRSYEEYVSGRRLPEDEGLVCVVMDVNELKRVNDNMGHEAGDELIKGAAGCIRECFGKYGRIFRIGGDEFVAIIFAEEGELNKILADFDSSMKSWRGKLNKELSVSYGYVYRNDYPNSSLRDIVKRADMRMYEAKNKYYKETGRDRRIR